MKPSLIKCLCLLPFLPLTRSFLLSPHLRSSPSSIQALKGEADDGSGESSLGNDRSKHHVAEGTIASGSQAASDFPPDNRLPLPLPDLPSAASPLESAVPTILARLDAFYDAIQSNNPQESIQSFLTFPDCHHVPPRSTCVRGTTSSSELVDLLVSVSRSLKISCENVQIVAESKTIVVTSHIEKVTESPAAAASASPRHSVHDKWSYATTMTWVKRGSKWLIASIVTGDYVENHRSDWGDGGDVRRPSHRVRRSKYAGSSSSSGSPYDGDRVINFDETDDDDDEIEQDDILQLMRALGGLKGAGRGGSQNSQGLGQGRIVLALKGGGAGLGGIGQAFGSPSSSIVNDGEQGGKEGEVDGLSSSSVGVNDSSSSSSAAAIDSSNASSSSKASKSNAEVVSAIVSLHRSSRISKKFKDHLISCVVEGRDGKGDVIRNAWDVLGGIEGEFGEWVKEWGKREGDTR